MKCPHCGGDLGIDNNNTYENNNSYNKNTNNINDKIDYNKHPNLNKSTNQYNYSFNENNIDITDEEFIAFVGDKKKDYYLEKFNIFKTDNKFGSWNWPAFLFSSCWLLYRKMYLPGILLLCLKIFIAMLLPFFLGIVSFIVSILMGIFGNNIYIRHVNKRIKKIKNNSYNIKREYYFRHIRFKGETNIVAAFISAFIYLIIMLLLMTFTIAKYSSYYNHSSKHYYNNSNNNNNNNNNNRDDNHSSNDDKFNEFDDNSDNDDSDELYNKYDVPIDSPIHNY